MHFVLSAKGDQIACVLIEDRRELIPFQWCNYFKPQPEIGRAGGCCRFLWWAVADPSSLRLSHHARSNFLQEEICLVLPPIVLHPIVDRGALPARPEDHPGATSE